MIMIMMTKHFSQPYNLLLGRHGGLLLSWSTLTLVSCQSSVPFSKFLKRIRFKWLKTGKPTLPWFGGVWSRLLGSFYLFTSKVFSLPHTFVWARAKETFQIRYIIYDNDNGRHELSERLLDSAQLSLNPAGLSLSTLETTLRYLFWILLLLSFLWNGIISLRKVCKVEHLIRLRYHHI